MLELSDKSTVRADRHYSTSEVGHRNGQERLDSPGRKASAGFSDRRRHLWVADMTDLCLHPV